MTQKKAAFVFALVICLWSISESGHSQRYYQGVANAELEIYRVESGNIQQTWTEPVDIGILLALTPFDQIEVLDFSIDTQGIVYEDASQNFAHDYSVVASISGSPQSISRINTSDRWSTEFFSTDTDIAIDLDRIVFDEVSQFSKHETHPNIHFTHDVIDIGNYPDSIAFNRFSTWTDFGSIPYGTDKHLSLVLTWPGPTSLLLVPEPSTFFLLATSAAALCMWRRE